MAHARQKSNLVIPIWQAEEENERPISVSFSEDYSKFEKLLNSLSFQAQEENDTVTPKFIEEKTFTKTAKEYNPKLNCLIDHPDLEEFFGISGDGLNNCNCTLY